MTSEVSPGGDYYLSAHPACVRRVLGGRNDRRLSICSFIPDYPDVAFFRDAAIEIGRLEQKEAFAASVFWEALADQATYSVRRRDLEDHGWPSPVAKLVGMLATAGSNIHPGFLLIALSLAPDRDLERVRGLLRSVGSAVLYRLRATVSLQPAAVVDRMRDGLEDHMFPDSIRAYVPYGDRYRYTPDWSAVREWAGVARATIDAARRGEP